MNKENNSIQGKDMFARLGRGGMYEEWKCIFKGGMKVIFSWLSQNGKRENENFALCNQTVNVEFIIKRVFKNKC